ncbi:hypothetical protein EVAR_75659_1 [Eumeta japonica]|uniref:Uncharacterized protein n=1 Tax=Eumeta variegata TaxID=151549 RepID=A0A4C1U0C4_EUMVA|nr:hypothetical protein EVAR_75659_1 [Eumeta japonica]
MRPSRVLLRACLHTSMVFINTEPVSIQIEYRRRHTPMALTERSVESVGMCGEISPPGLAPACEPLSRTASRPLCGQLQPLRVLNISTFGDIAFIVINGVWCTG